MLHILLTILKILGIVLISLLALLVFFLAIILFVPIRYRLIAQKDADVINGKARISWLFGILAFVVLYEEKNIDYQIRVLGVDVMGFINRLSKPKESKVVSSNKNANKEENIKEKIIKVSNKEPVENSSCNEHKMTVADEKAVDSEINNNDCNKRKEKIKLLQKIKNGIQKIRSSISKLKLTIKNIYDKINYWKNFISDQRTKDALGYVKLHFVKIVKHIMPKRLKGAVTYGFDDPCKTGQVLAGVSMFYPLYYKSLALYPDFSGPVLNGHVDLKGRLYVIFFVKSALQIFFNKNVQFIINNFRNKEAS